MPETQKAYCVKCRETREMKNPVPKKMKNGVYMLQCPCPVCGTKMSKIVGKTLPAGIKGGDEIVGGGKRKSRASKKSRKSRKSRSRKSRKSKH